MHTMGKDTGGQRGRRADSTQRAPRPGGRAAAREATDMTTGTAKPAYPTRGSTALAPEAETRPAVGKLGPWLKVAPPLPVSVPRAPFVMLVLLVVVGGVLGILVVNTKINENAFRLDKLQQQQTALNLQQQDLEQQIAYFESPGNLAAAARKLGLVPAGSPAFIQLPDGKVIGVPQPAGRTPTGTGQPPAAGR